MNHEWEGNGHEWLAKRRLLRRFEAKITIAERREAVAWQFWDNAERRDADAWQSWDNAGHREAIAWQF